MSRNVIHVLTPVTWSHFNRLDPLKQETISNLDNDEEIFSGVTLTDDHLTLLELGRFKGIGDRQSLPLVQARYTATTHLH